MDDDAMATLARRALAMWDPPDDTDVRPIRLLNNAVFAVTTPHGERFALRLHRAGARGAPELAAELMYLEAVGVRLADIGVAVPPPVRNRDGVLVSTVATGDDGTGGIWHCDLTGWVDGAPLRGHNGLEPQHAGMLGRALGTMHACSEVFEPPAGFALPTWDAEAMFTDRSGYGPADVTEFLDPEQQRRFAEVADRTAELFADLGRDRDAFGVIHFDFILGNCHFTTGADGARLGVIDFSDCGFGSYLYDLAPMLGNFSDYPEFPRLREAFLAGYRTVRELPTDQESLLPLLMAARHASTCLWVISAADGNPHAPDPAGHIAWRMDEVERCLSLT